MRITGPYSGVTGHDNQVRSIARALHQLGVEIELRNLGGWSPTQLPEAEACMEAYGHQLRVDQHLHFCMPHQLKPSRRCRNINFTMFEATRLSPVWREASLRHDLIIVPTESSRDCWIDSGIPGKKVKICPLGVDFNLFQPSTPPLKLATEEGRPLSSFRFRFLNVAESIYRKNLSGLLQVWLTATTRSDDAVLVLKTGFYNQGSRQEFDEQLRAIENRVGKRFEEAAPLVIFDAVLPIEEMPSLYLMATHYWSMSHGEGFDLPMLEAAASGLQLIAPDHSAYRHYLRPAFSFLIPAREIPVHIPNNSLLNQLFIGANWWEPDQPSAEKLLRGLLDGLVPPTASARTALQPHYSWDATARRLIEILEEDF